jgi:hypothetical protein
MQELQDAGAALNQKGFHIEGVIEYLNELIQKEKETGIIIDGT